MGCFVPVRLTFLLLLVFNAPKRVAGTGLNFGLWTVDLQCFWLFKQLKQGFSTSGNLQSTRPKANRIAAPTTCVCMVLPPILSICLLLTSANCILWIGKPCSMIFSRPVNTLRQLAIASLDPGVIVGKKPSVRKDPREADWDKSTTRLLERCLELKIFHASRSLGKCKSKSSAQHDGGEGWLRCSCRNALCNLHHFASFFGAGKPFAFASQEKVKASKPYYIKKHRHVRRPSWKAMLQQFKTFTKKKGV